MPLRYFGIRVTNLERSVKFYIEGLGLEEEARGTMSHGGIWVSLEDPTSKQRLELNFYPPGNTYDTPYTVGEGLDHLGFKVEDVGEELARLRKLGAHVVVEPWVEPGGEIISYVTDPDGNWVEVYSVPQR
jgi:catechol 2,3-dioxygenase-like lactoylglutathione lyase family enzyme